ncbi:MAG TPA: SDR family oxidoreductase [Chitinophagales bacterium]|nr:SDR family oxidoreductase [Chitinophagales bacterium]
MKVLITGASRGIGRTIGAELLKQGCEVIGTSRNPEAMDTSSRLEFPMLKLDISIKESILQCSRQAGDIDVLINNAGISQMGAVEEIPAEKMRALFETNFFGLVELTRCFLPQMRKKRQGFIINIGSLAGKFAVPFKSGYVASKFALAGFTWSLRNEVMPFGIKVTVIEPADIHTTIEPELFIKDGSEYSQYVEKVKNARRASMDRAAGPEVVARKVSWLLKNYWNNDKQPAPFYAAGRNGSLLVNAKRFLPDSFTEKMVRRSYGLE